MKEKKARRVRQDAATLTMDQVAKQLGIGRNSAYEAARKGQIPIIRIGKLIRCPKAALDRMLEAKPSV